MSWWDPGYVEPEEDMRPYRLNRALYTLTAKQRFVVELRFGLRDGTCYTLREIAECMGVAPRTVLEHQEAGLRKLARSSTLTNCHQVREGQSLPLDDASSTRRKVTSCT